MLIFSDCRPRTRRPGMSRDLVQVITIMITILTYFHDYHKNDLVIFVTVLLQS